MRASRRTNHGRASFCFALVVWRTRARRSMASEGGSDPSEDAAKLFAVTESLVGAGIAPSIHQGRGIVVSALSKNTVRATIETGDDEEGFSFEIVKEELWRAVKLLEEHGCGSGIPSSATSLDSKALRIKMAGMFMMNEMSSVDRASTSSGVVPSTRARVSSLSPAAALSAPSRSGTPATSESRADVAAAEAAVASGGARVLPRKDGYTPAGRGRGSGVNESVSRGRGSKRGEKESKGHHSSAQQTNTLSTYPLIPQDFPTGYVS